MNFQTWKYRAVLGVVAIVVLGFAFIGCGDKSGGGGGSTSNATGITLNKNQTTLAAGAEETLTATVSPADANDKTVIWSTSHADVATVSSAGKVTAVAPGSAAIIATTKNGKAAACVVTVPGASVRNAPVEEVILDETMLTLEVGDTEVLNATVEPEDANQTVIWSTSAPTVASVSNGTVLALSVGTATITATSVEDGTKSASCTVTVTPADPNAIHVTGVTLDKDIIYLAEGGNTATLSATIEPANATNKAVSWHSSNTAAVQISVDPVTEVATVHSVASGAAIITVTTQNSGRTAFCVVIVTPPEAVTGVELNKSAIALAEGYEETLIATVLPTNAGNKNVIWSSDEEDVATVSTTGAVRGVAEGKANITVTTEDGGFEASCVVFVTLPVDVTGVNLAPSTLSLAEGNSGTLTVIVLPVNASNKTVIWESEDEDIATVTDGIVTGVAEGTTTITVITADGGFDATCAVTVTPYTAVTGITLKQTLRLPLEEYETLIPTVEPAGATNKTISGWSSSNPTVATVIRGTVTAVAVGTATITATTADGEFDAACEVTVIVPPEYPGMPWIKNGTFMMGSPDGEPGSNDNEAQRQVTLTKGFYMDEYPMTQGFYRQLMGSNNSYHPTNSNSLVSLRDDFPVDRVTWYNAIIFCNRLSMAVGLSPAYEIQASTGNPAPWTTNPAQWGNPPTNSTTARWNNVRIVAGSEGYRLPTEAQWEYACRAGTTTVYNFQEHLYDPVNKEYIGVTVPEVWGSNYAHFEWANFDGGHDYNGRSAGTYWYASTLPVYYLEIINEQPPNAWGLYLMHGTVAEWCWDWYGSYRTAGNTDPMGPAAAASGSVYKMARGGGYYWYAEDIRSAARDAYAPYFANGTGQNAENYAWIGFRVVVPYSETLEALLLEEDDESAPSAKMRRSVSVPTGMGRAIPVINRDVSPHLGISKEDLRNELMMVKKTKRNP